MCQLTIFTENSNKEVIPPILGKDTSVIESSPENEKNTVCDLIPSTVCYQPRCSLCPVKVCR